MIKLILKIAVVYVVLQYGFKVDINGYVRPYLDPLLGKVEKALPEEAQVLLEKAKPLAEAAGDNAIVDYVKNGATAVDDAKQSVKALEEKMKKMQEEAGKALEDNN
jgi:uncharacterized protein YoxC